MKRPSLRVHLLSAALAGAITAAGVLAWAQVTPAFDATVGGVGGAAGVFGSAAGAVDDDLAEAHGRARAGAVGVAHGGVGVTGAGLSLHAQVEALPAEPLVETSASASLDARAMVRAIHQFSADSRKQLVTAIHARLETSAVVIARLHRQARAFDDQAKADFKAAAKIVELREDQLRKSLKAASKVSADSWADARAAVAADYAAYAEAVARAEAVAHAHRATPVPEPKAKGEALSTAATETTPKAPQAQVGAATPSTTTASATTSRPPTP
ncbi:MAG TPA: hypothetical protein VGD81_17965 [Opitutaceae bacterium]